MLIETPDAYADMWANKHHYDFSDYPKDNQYHYDSNKKVIGKFKDECNSVPVAKFVGLQSKIYSIKKSNLNEIRRAKGIVKSSAAYSSAKVCYGKGVNTRKICN